MGAIAVFITLSIIAVVSVMISTFYTKREQKIQKRA